jgi:bacillithiol biosynthesis cysteine-adding enzyme BshC
MNCTNSTLPYKKTGYFSGLVTDYLEQAATLRPFYTNVPDLAGIKAAIEARKKATSHRQLLVTELQKQYERVATSDLVKQHIALLQEDTTFTITTAHQPAIFTGTLYFVYKILHAIRLAAQLKKEWPQYNFVPVYYMGSEDADLEELGKIYLGSEKIVWDTKQTGAVGRMQVKGLEKIITRIEGELSVQPHGKELVQLLKDSYLGATNIQTATFKLINTLFAEYGLLVLIPDNARLKSVMQPVFEDDLLQQTPSGVVGKTIERLSQHYKVQANPRAINLFYLIDNKRERIEIKNGKYEVLNTDLSFTKEEILKELKQHAERFSPNVILRGMFQETILPNIAFIGGGGETAYWLELKDLFEHFHVPYPVLVVRNSFLVVEKKWQEKIAKLGFTSTDFFKTEQELLTQLVSRSKNGELKLEHELTEVLELYRHIKEKASNIDKTLVQHIEALQVRATKPLQELEKKMLRAEKRKYEDEQRHIHTVKTALFPLNSLQERIENFMPYYAKWGKDFISMIYKNSLALEQEFVVLQEL